MEPRIIELTEKKLIGKRMKMSLIENKTSELWRNFMMDRKKISNPIGTDLYSMQLYGPQYFDLFSPATEFEKWATTEVTDFDHLPEGMESFLLNSGLYAVFTHKGPASAGFETFGYIFGKWLPESVYALDDRPHFEILGEKYKNDAADSEEEIWIPIKPRQS